MSSRPLSQSLAGRLGLSAGLIAIGLACEAVSFTWNHPLSFVLLFMGGAGLLVLGVVNYLWAIARA